MSTPLRGAAILLECDPGHSLGGSPSRDIAAIHRVLAGITASGAHPVAFAPTDVHILTTNAKAAAATGRLLGVHGRSSELLSTLAALGAGPEDPRVVVLLLTGHGYQERDRDGDEADGLDEYIRVDGGTITDDALRVALAAFPERTHFITMADTCHSGTLVEGAGPAGVHFGACSDTQLSQCDVGDVAGFGGSLTVALVEDSPTLQALICEPALVATKGRLRHTGYASFVDGVRGRLALLGQELSVWWV